jgi:hypothetical protein
MGAPIQTPDIIIGGRQLKSAPVAPLWDTQGSGPAGEDYYQVPITRTPLGVTLQPIPLVNGPEKIDLSNPPTADVLPVKGLSGIKRQK